MERWPKETKMAAISLIESGVSYAQIGDRLSVPKSTLSFWMKEIDHPRDPERQLRHLRSARKVALQVIAEKKLDRIKLAESNAKCIASQLALNRDTSKALLAMLYWAEGGKRDGNMKFTNTDVDLVLLFVSLLRRAYEIDESRLHVALQIHSYHELRQVKTFWSKKLKIPESQFWKPYLKPRGNGKKYRENFAGICNLHYASSAVQRELMSLGREIANKLL